MAFYFFLDLPLELQEHILTFLDPKGWANVNIVNKNIKNLSEGSKVRRMVFRPYTHKIGLPSELDFIRLKTEGKPYLDPEYLYTEGFFGFLVIGIAYNPCGLDLNYQKWQEWFRSDDKNIKDLSKTYFSMFVSAYTDGQMGYFESLSIKDGTCIEFSVEPNQDYWKDHQPHCFKFVKENQWEKWSYQFLSEWTTEKNVAFFIPCDLWVYPYTVEIYDEYSDQYYVELVYNGLFPSLEGVTPIQSFQDLKKLSQKVKYYL